MSWRPHERMKYWRTMGRIGGMEENPQIGYEVFWNVLHPYFSCPVANTVDTYCLFTPFSPIFDENCVSTINCSAHLIRDLSLYVTKHSKSREFLGKVVITVSCWLILITRCLIFRFFSFGNFWEMSHTMDIWYAWFFITLDNYKRAE